MKNKKYFSCSITNDLWEIYFTEVDGYLVKIPYAEGVTIRQELESHAFEAVQEMTEGKAFEKLKRALDSLGKPEEIVPPMVAEVLIKKARKSNNPFDIINAVFYQIKLGTKNTVHAISILLLTVFSIILFVMATLKLFMSENIGIFTDDSGEMSFGIIRGAEQWQEHVGLYIIPISFVLSFILYRLAMLMLKRFKSVKV